MVDVSHYPQPFLGQYQLHLKHLLLKGLQPKTIDAYARGMRRMGEYFVGPAKFKPPRRAAVT